LKSKADPTWTPAFEGSSSGTFCHNLSCQDAETFSFLVTCAQHREELQAQVASFAAKKAHPEQAFMADTMKEMATTIIQHVSATSAALVKQMQTQAQPLATPQQFQHPPTLQQFQPQSSATATQQFQTFVPQQIQQVTPQPKKQKTSQVLVNYESSEDESEEATVPTSKVFSLKNNKNYLQALQKIEKQNTNLIPRPVKITDKDLQHLLSNFKMEDGSVNKTLLKKTFNEFNIPFKQLPKKIDTKNSVVKKLLVKLATAMTEQGDKPTEKTGTLNLVLVLKFYLAKMSFLISLFLFLPLFMKTTLDNWK
jgi:hypothetical protein